MRRLVVSNSIGRRVPYSFAGSRRVSATSSARRPSRRDGMTRAKRSLAPVTFDDTSGRKDHKRHYCNASGFIASIVLNRQNRKDAAPRLTVEVAMDKKSSVADTMTDQQAGRVANLRTIPPNEPCPDGEICWDDQNGWRGSGLQFIIAAVIAPVVVIAMVLTDLLKGARVTNWSDFGDMNNDGDIIDLSETAGTPGVVTVTMTTPPSVTWWKSANIYDAATQKAVAEADGFPDGAVTEGDEHRRTVKFRYNRPEDLRNYFLLLSKAKTLGVHSKMYAVFDLSSKAGKHLTFNWRRDTSNTK